MNDFQMLELAAKAAGYEVEFIRNSGCFYRCEEEVGREDWNPLDDDGDALRLAIKLNIAIHLDLTVGSVITSFAVGRMGYNTHEEVSENKDCPYKAARRAIVSAAAKIGDKK